jgi:hypothetical protein
MDNAGGVEPLLLVNQNLEVAQFFHGLRNMVVRMPRKILYVDVDY